MAAHTNKIMNISLKRNLGTFTYLFCFTLLVSCVSAEVAPKTSNIKPATGFDSQSSTTSGQSPADSKNSNPYSLANFRLSLRQQLRKKLVTSLSFTSTQTPVVTTPAPATLAKPAVLSQLATSPILIDSSPNNATSSNNTEVRSTAAPEPLPSLPLSAPSAEPVSAPAPVSINPITPVVISNELAQKQQDIINQVKIQVAQQSLATKIQTIFARLPLSTQLDSVIMTADSYALVRTVQQAGTSTLSCEQKVSYLSDFFGRIQIAVKMKNFTLATLNTMMEAAKTQIKRLNQEISRNNDEILNLGLDDLKRKLNEGLLQLSTAYSNYNKAESLIEPKKIAISKSHATIQSYKTKIDSGRQEIPNKKLELAQINANISLLEQQLSEARAKKNLTQDYISNLELNIKGYEQKMEDQKNNEMILELELSKINDESDRSKSSYKVLEVDVQRFRADVAKKSQKEAEIQAKIANLQNKISAENKKYDINEQTRLQNFVKDLKSVIPSVQMKIDEVNYRCNDVKQIEPISLKSGEMILFLITPKDFYSYIQASYLTKMDASNIKPIKISLISSNIMDRAWQQQLGNPYPSPAYYQSNQFSFNGDFNCLAPSELETGFGTIRKVGKKSIEIDGEKMRYLLNLGACSRIQSPQQIPQVGQKLYFRGRKVQQGEYNVYKVSCF